MRANDLIEPIITLHKKREGIDQISQREANLVVAAIEIFQQALDKKEVPASSVTDPDMPEWLTGDVREMSKKLWDSHQMGIDDHYRVHAIQRIQNAALDAGYVIGLNKAMSLFQKYCNR